jgi:hypothetical protein
VIAATGKETEVKKPRPEDQEWYFFKAGSDAGLKAGPFSWERLVAHAQNGTLERADVVWDPNSGWKKAEQVPGLFPAATSPWVTGSASDTPPLSPPPETPGRSRVYWLAALATLVIIGGALGAYFGLARDDGTATTTTTITIAVTTTRQAATTVSEPTTVAEPTTVTETTTVSGTPVRYLDEKDSGHELVAHVGDRLRVEFKPRVSAKVKAVSWFFLPEGTNIVQKTGSDSEIVDGGIVSTWVELQAVAAGRVTVRAKYEYPDGTIIAMWVVYLFIQ